MDAVNQTARRRPRLHPASLRGHNKTFFFVDYEGFRLRQGQSFTETVPTPAERTGDFSNLRDTNGNLVPIYDPLTTVAAANGQYARTQSQGNVLPPNKIESRVAPALKSVPAAQRERRQ